MSPLALAAALALALPAASAAAAGVRGLEPDRLPADQRARWPLVVQKCGRCHSMDVALNPGYGPVEWKASMRRMVRLPGAAITPAQEREIMLFLRFYATEAQRR